MSAEKEETLQLLETFPQPRTTEADRGEQTHARTISRATL